jgi:uncharacterized protein (TIGR03000 family)
MTRLSLWIAALAGASMLTPAHPAEAAPFRPILPLRTVGSARPVYPRNGMPGSDWWRIYPWSPYNYGRNPYNPIVVPYPYPYVYPYPVYPPPLQPIDDETVADETTFPSHQGRDVLIPFPTGEMKKAPLDAGVIVVRVPTEFTKVLFDGERTYTTGLKRYFVTPSLTSGKIYHYALTVSWEEDGRTVSKERDIAVQAGTTVVLDFRSKGRE